MADHLGVVLPGRAYGPHGPVLHLPRLALQQSGARVEALEYALDAGPAAFDADVARQVAALVAEHQPRRLTFVAKSLGTMALAALDSAAAGVDGVERVDAIWLTPLFERADLRGGAIRKAWPALVVAGDADPAHHPDGHRAVCEAIGATSVVLPGADHCLEVDGDVLRSIDAFRALTAAVLEFIGGP